MNWKTLKAWVRKQWTSKLETYIFKTITYYDLWCGNMCISFLGISSFQLPIYVSQKDRIIYKNMKEYPSFIIKYHNISQHIICQSYFNIFHSTNYLAFHVFGGAPQSSRVTRVVPYMSPCRRTSALSPAWALLTTELQHEILHEETSTGVKHVDPFWHILHSLSLSLSVSLHFDTSCIVWDFFAFQTCFDVILGNCFPDQTYWGTLKNQSFPAPNKRAARMLQALPCSIFGGHPFAHGKVRGGAGHGPVGLK